MRRILGISGCLRASAIALLLASGCAQSEGERCQITSDCADGLTCQSVGEGAGEGISQGNGVCKPPVSVTSTAKDAAADAPPTTGPEPTIDAGSVTAPDATSLDTGAID
jgi:hypothetical protein